MQYFQMRVLSEACIWIYLNAETHGFQVSLSSDHCDMPCMRRKWVLLAFWSGSSLWTPSPAGDPRLRRCMCHQGTGRKC
jgi:hypothetical protein